MTNKKLALVTGSARGLGLAMVQALIHDGFEVVGWDLKNESKFQHPLFHLESVNVTDEKSVESNAQKLKEKWGVPSVLVNNAGITRDCMLHKMSVEDFEATWKVNVLGTFLPTKIVGGFMRDEQSQLLKQSQPLPFKRIIMISSIAGVYGNVGQTNYAASKAAVVAFMKSVSKEWGKFQISCVAIAPGLMKTEMTETIPQEVLNQFLSRTPLGRMGTAEELGALVAYLSQANSGFLHSELISFGGGLLL